MFLTGCYYCYVAIYIKVFDSISAKPAIGNAKTTTPFHNNMFNIDLYSIYGLFLRLIGV
jgi:hypothetical protein